MLNIDELKDIPLLRGLNVDDLRALAEAAEQREFPPGTEIFSEGSQDNSLFIILSGDVRISKSTASGEEKSIALLSQGGFFGEMALFDDYFRSATATAAGHVRVLQISKDSFTKLLSTAAGGASKLLLEIMKTLAPRIRQTNLELVSLYEAGRIIGKGGEPGKILSGLLSVLHEATLCTRGAAFLINQPAARLECRAAFGYDADPSSWTEPLEGGVAGEILSAEGATVIDDYQNKPLVHEIGPIGYETSSMLAVSLRIQGQPIGMIVLSDKTGSDGKPSRFTAGDMNILAGVAAQAAGAIESARLHEEAREKEKLDRVYYRF
ncbi:MAG: GAF domain-containing protein [Candidatus Abyssobacteria bacterium SURF_5]|uniref:GAF domain-containing protein n=1 Tax=Abyssobacteria bacterium (strain SURF_5) TaxID=2093360 RepID=A0A3A4NEJ0_ABYX5|nr:MAG: GAF domain-containing protein [Candidatus Abyssubacteria bacterium SURF_5]